MDKIKRFFSGVKKETKRTHWPKGKELTKDSIICVTMILFFGIFFYALDALFAFLRGVIS